MRSAGITAADAVGYYRPWWLSPRPRKVHSPQLPLPPSHHRRLSERLPCGYSSYSSVFVLPVLYHRCGGLSILFLPRAATRRETGQSQRGICICVLVQRKIAVWVAKKPDIFGLFAGDIFFVSALCCNVTEGKLLLKLEIRKYLFTIHSYLLHKILNASLAKSEKVIFSSNSILYRVNFTL